MYMPLSYCSCSCLPVGGTMAGWGIPVGCMPDGPSMREWGNLVEVERNRREERKSEEDRKWVSSEEWVESGGLRGRRASKQEWRFGKRWASKRKKSLQVDHLRAASVPRSGDVFLASLNQRTNLYILTSNSSLIHWTQNACLCKQKVVFTSVVHHTYNV